MEKQYLGPKLRGPFILNDVQKIREVKGETGVNEFYKRVGTIDFSPVRSYPLEQAVDIFKIAAEIIYDRKPTGEDFRNLGRWDFRLILDDSPLGKVMRTLFARDIKSTVKNIPHLFSVAYEGLHSEVNFDGDNKATVVVYPTVYPPEYMAGMFEEGMQHFDPLWCKADFTVEENYKHLYHLSWEMP